MVDAALSVAGEGASYQSIPYDMILFLNQHSPSSRIHVNGWDCRITCSAKRTQMQNVKTRPEELAMSFRLIVDLDAFRALDVTVTETNHERRPDENEVRCNQCGKGKGGVQGREKALGELVDVISGRDTNELRRDINCRKFKQLVGMNLTSVRELVKSENDEFERFEKLLADPRTTLVAEVNKHFSLLVAFYNYAMGYPQPTLNQKKDKDSILEVNAAYIVRSQFEIHNH